MKKVYYAFILIVSSFFLFNYEVRAATYEFTLTEEYVNEYVGYFTKYSTKRISDNYVNNTSNDYLYYYNWYYEPPVGFIYSSFVIDGDYYFTDSSNSNYLLELSMNIYNCQAHNQLNTCSSYTRKSYIFSLIDDVNVYNSNFIYSTIPNLTYQGEHEILISYKDKVYQIKNGFVVPTLYDFYTLNEDVLVEYRNFSLLDDFYSLSIEKINFLSESFVNNYVYLSVFVILIIVILIELIRRYLL